MMSATARLKASAASVFVGMPVARGIRPETVLAILSMFQRLPERGIDVSFQPSGGPTCELARAEAVSVCLEANATHYFSLDADVVLDAEVLQQMLELDLDVVVGVYRGRRPPFFGSFVFLPLTGASPIVHASGARTLEIAAAGLGCALIKRRVFERLHELHSELRFVSARDRHCVGLFNPTIGPDPSAGHEIPRLYVDDYAFWPRVRAAGFQVHALLDATVDHDGVVGCFGDYFPRTPAEAERLRRADELARALVAGAGELTPAQLALFTATIMQAERSSPALDEVRSAIALDALAIGAGLGGSP